MDNFIRAGRAFYGAGLAGIGIQHFIYADFRPMILPYWPSFLPGLATWAYISGAALILVGAVISLSKRARLVAIVLGIIFFVLFLFHAYYQLFPGGNSLVVFLV